MSSQCWKGARFKQSLKSHLLLLRNFRRNKWEMFETKKDYNETEMRTLIELLYGSIAIKEQALSSKIFLWGTPSVMMPYWFSHFKPFLSMTCCTAIKISVLCVVRFQCFKAHQFFAHFKVLIDASQKLCWVSNVSAFITRDGECRKPTCSLGYLAPACPQCGRWPCSMTG